MRKHLATIVAAAALAAASLPAHAGLLTFSVLSDDAVVPQSSSAPCIICSTQQAHNPDGFGFNNFVSTGNTVGGNFFSTALVGGSLASGDEAGAIPYTVGQIGQALLNNLTFGVAIDVNSAQGAEPMTLDLFRLWRVSDDGLNTNIDLLAFINGPILMPDIRTGNGSADYLLSGFDLSSLQLGDRLIFQAQFSGATDGGESFYLVAQAVPGPIVGAGIPGLVIACGMMLGLARNRKRKQALGLA